MTPQQLRNSILQLAMEGKLVEQRTEDGIAEELYIQVQEEKKQLIKEGAIKKEKPLPEIEEKEIPFDIPKTWKWCRLGDVGIWKAGTTPSRSNPKYYRGNIPWLKTGDLNDGYIHKTPEMVSDLALKETNLHLNSVGSVLIAMYGATIGKLGILAIPATTNQACCACRPFDGIFNKFLFYYLLANRINFKKKGTGGAQPNISREKIVAYLFPLPPLAEQKRIVEKLEELMPLVDRYEEAWTKLEAFNARFPKDMQNSILQMAMEGKLVEQRPEEGTAEELFEQIQAEKKRLIKEGKSKKDKKLFLDIEEKEIPFDIPENWKWTNLGRLLRKLTDGTHKTPKYTTSGVKFVSVKDMSNGVLSLKNTKFISEEEHQELYSRCDPEYGDMLLSKVGTTGVPAIVDTHEPFSLFVSVALLKYNHDFIDEKFFYYLLKSPLVQSQASEKTRGMANKNWVLDKIANTLVVLPPLAEQKRIVAKLEELLPLCERLKS